MIEFSAESVTLNEWGRGREWRNGNGTHSRCTDYFNWTQRLNERLLQSVTGQRMNGRNGHGWVNERWLCAWISFGTVCFWRRTKHPLLKECCKCKWKVLAISRLGTRLKCRGQERITAQYPVSNPVFIHLWNNVAVTLPNAISPLPIIITDSRYAN